MLVYEGRANDFHRELSRIKQKSPFCLCARANHALRALITRKILRSKAAQCKTEGSPLKKITHVTSCLRREQKLIASWNIREMIKFNIFHNRGL